MANAAVQAVPFFEALSRDELRSLRSVASQRSYGHGLALLHEGDAADRVILVLSGQVKLTRVTSEGNEVILAVRGAGELIGELAAIDGEPRSATATAVEPVDTLEVPALDF